MKLKNAYLLVFCFAAYFTQAQPVQPDKETVQGGELTIQPIMHATLVLQYQKKNFYIDPTGGVDAFKGLAAPDVILITDIHGDHLDPKTLDAVNTTHAVLIVPKAVANKLPITTDKTKLVILKNDETTNQGNITITAIPMYNLPESSTAFHTKGRGNGYVLKIGGKSVYISGDTADIPEM